MCLLYLRVLPLNLRGGGVRRFSFGNYSLYAPDSPSETACRPTNQVWFTMAFDPTTGKTTRYEKCHSLPCPSWLFSWAMRVLAHKKYRTRHFAWEPSSTYCRTAGHQLPPDGSNCLGKICPSSIPCCVVIALNSSRHRNLFPIPQNNEGVQLGSNTNCLVSFLKIMKIGLTYLNY